MMDDEQYCSDVEFEVYESCKAMYPDRIQIGDCSLRQQEEQKRRAAILWFPIAAVIAMGMLLLLYYAALVVTVSKQAKRSKINFSEIKLMLDPAGNPICSMLGRENEGMMRAYFRGQEVMHYTTSA